MFCFQCQEASKGTGCTIKGVCGKSKEVSNLQDLLVFVSKGVSIFASIAGSRGLNSPEADQFVFDALFMTITNANFDDQRICLLKQIYFLTKMVHFNLKGMTVVFITTLHE